MLIRRSPSGDWITVAALGEMLVAADIAQLDTIATSDTSDGSICWVQSLRDFFALDLQSTDDVTPTTVRRPSIVDPGDPGRWVRGEGFFENPSPWLSQTTWYISADNGNDENDGATDTTPLATFAELRRRLGPHPTIRQAMICYILVSPDEYDANGCDLNEVCRLEAWFEGADGQFTIYGGVRETAAQDAVATWTAFDVNSEGELTAAVIDDWTAYVGCRIELTSGAYAGYTYFVHGIGSSAVTNEVARVGPGAYNSAAAPPYRQANMLAGETDVGAPADTFDVQRLVRVRGLDLRGHRSNTQAAVRSSVLTFIVDSIQQYASSGEPFCTLDANVAPEPGEILFSPVLWRCYVGSGAIDGTHVQIWGCYGSLNPTGQFVSLRGHTGALDLSNGTLSECFMCCLSRIWFQFGSRAANLVQAGIFNSGGAATPPVMVDWLSQAKFGEVWGYNNDTDLHCFRIDGRAWYVDAADLTLAPATADYEVCLGRLYSYLYTDLPKQNNLAGGVDSNDAMFALLPVATCPAPTP